MKKTTITIETDGNGLAAIRNDLNQIFEHGREVGKREGIWQGYYERVNDEEADAALQFVKEFQVNAKCCAPAPQCAKGSANEKVNGGDSEGAAGGDDSENAQNSEDTENGDGNEATCTCGKFCKWCGKKL